MAWSQVSFGEAIIADSSSVKASIGRLPATLQDNNQRKVASRRPRGVHYINALRERVDGRNNPTIGDKALFDLPTLNPSLQIRVSILQKEDITADLCRTFGLADASRCS